MAKRVIKSLGKPGSVSRRKIRAAVLLVAKKQALRGRRTKRRIIRNSDTASGKKLIAFRKPSIKHWAA